MAYLIKSISDQIFKEIDPSFQPPTKDGQGDTPDAAQLVTVPLTPSTQGRFLFPFFKLN